MVLYRLIICGLAAADDEVKLAPNAELDPASLVLEFLRMLVLRAPVPRFDGEKLPCVPALVDVGGVLDIAAIDAVCERGT